MNSSIWASTWLVKELLITKLGCPVALPRFISRPSLSTMIDRAGRSSSAANCHSSTCGLILTLVAFGSAASPAMSISLSKWPMLDTIAWCRIRLIWSAVITSRLPVAVT